jgi:hypothetical protein
MIVPPPGAGCPKEKSRGLFDVLFGNCRILKGVRGALQEELSDFLEIRGTWSIYTRRS